jgi:hypothetical protein
MDVLYIWLIFGFIAFIICLFADKGQYFDSIMGVVFILFLSLGLGPLMFVFCLIEFITKNEFLNKSRKFWWSK